MKRVGNKAKLNTTRSGIRKRQRLKSGAGIAIRACLQNKRIQVLKETLCNQEEYTLHKFHAEI